MQTQHPLKIGLITDIHFDGSAPARQRLRQAVSALNRAEADGLVVMGDLANGTDAADTKRLLQEIAALCNTFRGSVCHIPGNHDLDYISKADFYDSLGQADRPAPFHFELGGRDFICLDGNYSPDGSAYDRGNFRWQEAWIPEEQLQWLRTTLNGLPGSAVLFSHQQICSAGTHAVRNDRAVRAVIHAAGNVAAVFQGHRHEDEIHNENGTTYYTLSAHVDGNGPGVIHFEATGLRLERIKIR